MRIRSGYDDKVRRKVRVLRSQRLGLSRAFPSKTYLGQARRNEIEVPCARDGSERQRRATLDTEGMDGMHMEPTIASPHPFCNFSDCYPVCSTVICGKMDFFQGRG